MFLVAIPFIVLGLVAVWLFWDDKTISRPTTPTPGRDAPPKSEQTPVEEIRPPERKKLNEILENR